MNTNFSSFLSQLGFGSDVAQKIVDNAFHYSLQISHSDSQHSANVGVTFHYFKNNADLFSKHLEIWNRNQATSFIAVLDGSTHIIDSRQKPNVDAPLSSRYIITSFDYGTNTPGFDFVNALGLITKNGIDNSSYFNFIIAYQAKKKANEVDKDLLLNLLALRSELVTKQNEQIVHLLLLRCLFVKYLEDRGVFDKNYLHDALSEQSPSKLITAFKKVRKINGDLFTTNELRAEDLQIKYLRKLSDFFGYYDYKTKQGKLFPYQFDKIPIQLISSIYESFLREETKKDKGVYYTPSILVRFILSQTVDEKLKSSLSVKILDPACGSGAFLVEAFRSIINAHGVPVDYNEKKRILQTQLFGIDVDPRALQIAAFSLYLALLENEDTSFIQEKIRIEAPILPSLIGKTLINANALVDPINFEINDQKSNVKFDCIVGNPPWGSVPEDGDPENERTRDALDNAIPEQFPIFQSVSDYQRSQAFLLKVSEWAKANALSAMVVNNSIFLNENSQNFRYAFLTKFALTSFYELSEINSILFKKHRIGKIKGESVEIGANEPCCVAIFKPFKTKGDYVSYIKPIMNALVENLRLITYRDKDVILVKQEDLLREDLLWRIFVNGGWDDYQIIKKRIIERDESVKIQCRSGFQPQKNMKSNGKPEYRRLIKPDHFRRYRITSKLDRFNWAQTLRRKPTDEVFQGERILLTVRPLVADQLRFRAVRTSMPIVHTHGILSVKITTGNVSVDIRPYLAIFNSKFVGFYMYNVSSQWGKGDAKRSTLRNSDIESIPLPPLENFSRQVQQLSKLVEKIEASYATGGVPSDLEERADNLVYDLYCLSAYERSVIDEFFEIHNTRSGQIVTKGDLDNYGKTFRSVFSLMLQRKYDLVFTATISGVNDAICSFTITPGLPTNNSTHNSSESILEVVRKVTAERSRLSNVVKHETVRYYQKETDTFYIAKTNLYRDWTPRQAINDANEEIKSIMKFIRSR